MERAGSRCSLPWFLETPCSLAPWVWLLPSPERQGLSTTASQNSEDYRFAGGLSLLSHRLWCTLLSLGSTVPHIRTPLGRPRQQLTAVRPGVPSGGGGKSSPPVPVLEDSSVCCSMRQPPPVPSRGAGTQWALGLGSLHLKPTSTTPRSWTSGVILKPSDP